MSSATSSSRKPGHLILMRRSKIFAKAPPKIAPPVDAAGLLQGLARLWHGPRSDPGPVRAAYKRARGRACA